MPNWAISATGYQLERCLRFEDAAGVDQICVETEADPLQRYVLELTAARASSTMAFVVV